MNLLIRPAMARILRPERLADDFVKAALGAHPRKDIVSRYVAMYGNILETGEVEEEALELEKVHSIESSPTLAASGEARYMRLGFSEKWKYHPNGLTWFGSHVDMNQDGFVIAAAPMDYKDEEEEADGEAAVEAGRERRALLMTRHLADIENSSAGSEERNVDWPVLSREVDMFHSLGAAYWVNDFVQFSRDLDTAPLALTRSTEGFSVVLGDPSVEGVTEKDLELAFAVDAFQERHFAPIGWNRATAESLAAEMREAPTRTPKTIAAAVAAKEAGKDGIETAGAEWDDEKIAEYRALVEADPEKAIQQLIDELQAESEK